MAVIKVSKPVNVEEIYVKVTCPECNKTLNMKMKGPVTRKNCGNCNRGTYVFTITPLRGEIVVTATFTNHLNVTTEIYISPEEVEVPGKV